MSNRIVREFTITRKKEDVELRAAFEIIRHGAELVGDIYIAGEDMLWNGKLSSHEKERVEEEIYTEYIEDEGGNSYIGECGGDSDFDDEAILKVAGLGRIYDI